MKEINKIVTKKNDEEKGKANQHQLSDRSQLSLS